MKNKFSPAPWREEITDDGDVHIVMDEAHRIFIGNLEDTCGTCHANDTLMRLAPQLLAELESLIPLIEVTFPKQQEVWLSNARALKTW